jgi:DNA adenine methylase
MLRYNRKGHFNIPFGRYKTVDFSALLDPEYQECFKNAELKCQSFVECLIDDPSYFYFLDPPYDSPFSNYKVPFGEPEHRQLATWFTNTTSQCLMIIGDTPFIRSLYEPFIVGEYPKKYRFRLHSGRVGNEMNTTHLIIKK